VLLGFHRDFETDSTFWNKGEEIPDGNIIQREIERAVSGKPFFYNDKDTGKPIRLQGILFEDFYYYYQIWEDWNVLKVLPHDIDQDIKCERRWVLDLLKMFEKVNNQVNNLIDKQIARKFPRNNN
jgi:hypothetical protein